MNTLKKSLAFRFVSDDLLVLRENKHTPTDADWDAFLTVLAANRASFAKLRILVFTEGGGPDAKQRTRLDKALDGRPVRVAVVTESTKVRFIVSSIALLNREICSFSNKEIGEAYEHLSLDPRLQRAAEKARAEMNSLVNFD